MTLILGISIVLLALGLATADYLFHRSFIRRRLVEAEERAEAIIEDADRQVELRLKEIEIEAKEKADATEAAFENEFRKKRSDIQAQRRQLEEQERNLERKATLLTQKKTEMDALEKTLHEREENIGRLQQELQASIEEQRGRLERVAGLSAQQARRELMREMEAQARSDSALTLKRIQEECHEKAEREGRRILVGAMQRIPSGQVIDLACSLVTLPNDEMKGRIIGREGRNIRALEMATGIDLIVDDTPGAIILSCFDPLRREVAKVSIERLVEDGRIHPGRIEEVVEKVRTDFEEIVLQTGETAAFELGIVNLPERLARLVGRMRYFVLSGYNLLNHCQEVSTLAALLAGEFEIGPELVKRAGLLHGIGYLVEGTPEGPPLTISADLASRHSESEEVVKAIRSLHPGESNPSLEGMLLSVARKTSLSRPGMRRDNMEHWIVRMRELEKVAEGFEGVARAFAMRSGKEIRVIVANDKTSDTDVLWLSKDIAARIEQEVNYPGQVRVSVIRETRAVDFAK